MIPLIIVFKKENSLSLYLNNFINENKIPKNLIFEIRPLNEEISINQIREIKKIIDIKTNIKKLFIFYSFNKATIDSQNAFLKTLEEKAINNIFIMVTDSLSQILPTIISRSKIAYLDKSAKDNTEKKEINLDSFLFKKNNFNFFSNKLFNIETKNQAKKIIYSLIYQLCDWQKRKINADLSSLIKKGIELLNLLENNNLLPQLTVDNYLILIKKEFKMNV